MSVERKQIQHYHTTNSEAIPNASDLLNGEIALNINKGNEKIFIKNNEGGISSFRGEQYYEENFLHKNDTAQSAIDLTGRIEATPEEFKYRPSAGEKSIKDDNANIKSIHGSSLVYNQLVYNPDFSNNAEGWNAYMINSREYTKSLNNGILSYTYSNSSPVQYWGIRTPDIDYNVKIGEKLLIMSKYKVSCDIDNARVYPTYCSNAGNNNKTSYVEQNKWCTENNILSITEEGTPSFGVRVVEACSGTIDLAYLYVISLTKMFGAGNEPATVDEFYARIPEGIDINAYNAGELINFTAESIKTTDLNQWDEQWELGRIDVNTGLPTDFTAAIRSKNYIRILPNKEYYLKGINNNTNIILFYDAEYNYISYLPTTNVLNKTFITPTNANYIKFYVGNAETPVTNYNNDICINLSHSGVRDGEYESYKEFTHDLSWIKKYFPNGMKSAGSAYDEITDTEAIQRIGEVDLGNLNWERHNYGNESEPKYAFRTYSVNDGIAPQGWVKSNILTSKYNLVIGGEAHQINLSYGAEYVSDNSKCVIKFRDDSYTDSESFKSSMSGVMLYYELAEPIVTPIEEVVNFSYEVGDFGTEEIISNGPTTPFKGDIVYQFNAVDRIRDNSRDIEKLKNSLNNVVKPNIAGGSSLVSILYGELVNLRDNTGLTPGTWYRITDYNTTVGSGEYLINTSVAGHQFDVIVLATSENTLSEEARAIQHDGDEYFNTSNLDAWKIWYCLDNDANRFEWADATNGKGVIYRMIDEYGNDCPYDFKNMLFEVYKITATTEYTSSLMGKYAIMNLQYPDTETNMFELDTENPRASYTFCMFDEYDGLAHDVSVEQTKYGGDVSDNKSLSMFVEGIHKLSPNIFVTDTTLCNIDQEYTNRNFGGYMLNNFDCMSGLNVFSDNAYGNVFDSVQMCIFGSDCKFNKATYTFMNAMGDNFISNNISQFSMSNVFDSGCTANNFGQYFMYNKIGASCMYNNFEVYCSYSIFDEGFTANNVGSYCYFTTIIGDDGENEGDGIMNYRIGSCIGIVDGEQTRTTIHLRRGVEHEMKVAKNSSGEIKVYCEADLIP